MPNRRNSPDNVYNDKTTSTVNGNLTWNELKSKK